MNFDTKMVLGRDEKQLVELTQKFFIKPISSPIFFDKAKYDNNEIVQINS